MDKITTITGVAVPLRRSNVDTDQIIPARFLKRVTKTGFDDALFAEWRGDPDFVLNREPFAHGTVLLAGHDFGTGSSREHAVWALRDYGFRAVISSRFADIFRGNAGKQGLVAATVSEETVERLMVAVELAPGTRLIVDLERRELALGEERFPFQIDDYTRWRLLNGLDDIDLTLREELRISEFEAARPGWLPRVT